MRKLHIVRRILFTASLVLLIFLAGLQSILLTFSEADILRQSTAQSARGQRIAKDALVLAYRPDTEHAQAISEMQNVLPAWEAQQSKMLAWRNSDLRLIAIQAQADFMAMDTAAKKILAHPKDKVDLVQVEIIVQHERNYSLLMSQLSTLIQQRMDDFNHTLVLFEQGIVVLLFGLKATQFILAEKERRKALKQQEETVSHDNVVEKAQDTASEDEP